MMRFRIMFRAVERGAIGTHDSFTEMMEGESYDEAHLKLYAKYDHIAQVRHVRLMFAPTFVNKDGLRQFMRPNRGHLHYETREDAQHWIDAVTANNSEYTLAQVWGSPETRAFEVREIECYDHGDAMRTVFEC